MSVDWLKIRNEYVGTEISTRKLAEKYGVSANTLQARAKREKWAFERAERCTQTARKCTQKSAEAVAAAEADRLSAAARIGAKASRFLEKRLDTLMECEAKAYEVKAIMETVRLIQDVYDRGPRQPEDDPLVSYLERLGKDE